MKKIIFILLLFPFVAISQKYQDPLLFGKTENGFNVIRNLGIPTICGDPHFPTLQDSSLKKSAIVFDSCNHRFWIYDPHLLAWDSISTNGETVQAGMAMKKNLDTLHAGGDVKGILNYYVPNPFAIGGMFGYWRIANRQTSDSFSTGPLGSGHVLTNEGPQVVDATYAPSMISVTRDLQERFNDTAALHYGGILGLNAVWSFDSSSTRYANKPIVRADMGLSVINQFKPPRDSVVTGVHMDGMTGAGVHVITGYGDSYGYNINVQSSIPGFPMGSIVSTIDLQRVDSRGRIRKMNGNGVSGFVSNFRSWQHQMVATDTTANNYIESVAALTDLGNTDSSISSTLTKEQILKVSEINKAYTLKMLPLWRPKNEIRNGIPLYQMGDSDMVHFNGMMVLGSTLSRHEDGNWPQYRFNLRGDGNITGSLWFNPQTGRIAGTSGTPSFMSPGTMFLITADSSNSLYAGGLNNQGANIQLIGNNVNSSTRGGIDAEVHFGQNSNAPFRIHFANYDGTFERRFLMTRPKFYVEVIDSISFRANYYKFAGMPTGKQAYVLMQDADGYTYKVDSTGLFAQGSSGGGEDIDQTLNIGNSLTTDRSISAGTHSFDITGTTGSFNPSFTSGGNTSTLNLSAGNLQLTTNANIFNVSNSGIQADISDGSGIKYIRNYGSSELVDLSLIHRRYVDSLFSIDAAADGTTKGRSTFTANDFNSSSGLISIDYTNGQSASGSNKGFLTSTDWTTFNNKLSSISIGTPIGSATAQSVAYYGTNGLLQQSPSYFKWDSTNKLLTVSSNATANTYITTTNNNSSGTASNGNQMYGGFYNSGGFGWSTTNSASRAVDFRWGTTVAQGSTNPTGNWELQGSINGGSWTSWLYVSSTGNVGIGASPLARLDINSGAAILGSVQTSSTGVNSNFFTGATTGTTGTTTANYLFPGGTGTDFRAAINGTTSTTATANRDVADLVLTGSVGTEAGSGTHPRQGTLFVGSKVITNGAGATDTAFGSYFQGPATGITPAVGSWNAIFNRGDVLLKYGKLRIGGAMSSTTGQIDLGGSTSGVISLLPQAAAGTYNWNYPTTAGSADQAVMSGGGGSNPMTYLDLKAGTFTPTLTNVTNVASSSVNSGDGHYQRVGNEVSFSITITVNPTAGTTFTEVDFSLPVASDLATSGDLVGPVSISSGSYVSGQSIGDATNNRGKISFTSISTSPHLVTVSGHYVIK